jgi:hypothetical protein
LYNDVSSQQILGLFLFQVILMNPQNLNHLESLFQASLPLHLKLS